MTAFQSKDFYETDKAVSEYLFFHYAAPHEFLLNGIGPQDAIDFPRRCGELDQALPVKRSRALDLGCAVGRAALELSKRFQEVVAIDYAHALIDSAKRVATGEAMQLHITDEGELTREVQIASPEGSRPELVDFQQGDAMNLPDDLGAFDFILMANLIDRLPDPRACLEAIHQHVSLDGVLAITSPYTWLPEYTEKGKWLGGFEREGIPVRTFDTLKEILLPKFSLLEERNMPFLIREHCRKNQYSIAHATFWQKR